MPNQISKGYDFQTGQLVTADNLDSLAQNATVRKGAISEQPNMAATVNGTYNYTTGVLFDVTSVAHGFSNGDRVKIVATHTSGANGSFFNGVYVITVISVDTYRITLPEEYSASAGNIVASLVPSSGDEILIHDISDVAEDRPKRLAISELLAVSDTAQFNEVKLNDLRGKTSTGINVLPVAGQQVTGATYSCLNGLSIDVTKASHGLAVNDVISITCTNTSGHTGAAYSGVFVVEAVTTNTFTYNLTEGAFIILNEHTATEVDQPLSSSGTAVYNKVGIVDAHGDLFVRQNAFVNGDAYLRGDSYVYGRAKFGEFVLPKGRTVSRPATPEEGQMFYNRDDDIVEIFRKSQAYPNGTWETFDKVSNVIIIPASYSTRTRIAETANTWYSKTLWTSTPIPYKQYEIQLPPIRIQHFNSGNDQSSYGKLELIAKDASNVDPNEYVIARYVHPAPSSIPFAASHTNISSIPSWNRIITPDNIDMSNMNLTLRVSVWQQQTPDSDDPNVNSFLESTWILPWIGFVRITPLVRKGGTAIPTLWKKESQVNSLNNITTAQREPAAWWTRMNGVSLNHNVIAMNTAYPTNMPAHIPMIVLKPYDTGYGSSAGAMTTSA